MTQASTLARTAYADGWWVHETLADALAREAARAPERVLIEDGATRLTAGRLAARALALAGAMLAAMPMGSVVSMMLPNWHEAAEIYLAATLAGMVVNPVLPSLRDHDLGFILSDSDARMVFIPAAYRQHDYGAMLARVAAALPRPPQVVVVRGDAGGHTAYAALFENAPAPAFPALNPDAVRMVMYTSGTTGRAKGVLHTHNSLHALLRQLGRHWLIAPGDGWLVPSPISHIGGSIYAFEMPLLLGTRAVLMEAWDAEAGAALIARGGLTHMAGATPFLQGLLAAARAAGTRLPSLKLFICGGASVPPDLIREGAGWFARAVVTRVYGSTEVPVTTVGVIDRADVAHAAETDGRPGIAEVRISPAGEICARGPQMFAGYLRAEDNPAAFDDDGFYRSGDAGRLEDGCLVVTGRIKDIIIRHGENIAPKEIEDILLTHPGIADIAIVGLPDARTGERACAVIVGAGEPPDLAGVRAYCEGLGIARFKIPEQVEHWQALPRNDAGKLLKHVIREHLLAGG